MNPIFAKTRYEYSSYSDFWRLVELSNFKTCYVDQMDLESEEVYVSTPVNGETRPHIFNRRSILKEAQKARIIIWQLERPISPSGSIDDQIVHMTNEFYKFSDAVWISDRFIASKDSRLTYLEMGSHPDLASGAPHPSQHDIAHVSCSVPRRDGILRRLPPDVRIAPNAWGAERDNILRQSRAMLNIHQDDTQVIEPLRIALAAAYKLPYLTERCYDLHPLVPGETCLEAPYHALLNSVPTWLTYKDLHEFGERLHKRLCLEVNFKTSVMGALQRTFQ